MADGVSLCAQVVVLMKAAGNGAEGRQRRTQRLWCMEVPLPPEAQSIPLLCLRLSVTMGGGCWGCKGIRNEAGEGLR